MAASLAYRDLDPENRARWPRALSDEEFRDRFPEETETVEFKQGLSQLPESIVAFSNTRGGVILCGVANNGKPVGIGFGSSERDKINDALSNTHSPGPINIGEIKVGERSVVVIGVGQLREGFSQTSNGRVLVRIGTRRVALIGNDLVRFIHDRGASSFEAVGIDASLGDVPKRLLRATARRLGVSDLAKAPARLRDRGLVATDGDGSALTVAGALYLTDRPDRYLGKSYVEILRFPGDGQSYDRRVQIDGPLPKQVAETTRAILDELGTEIVVLGLKRYDLTRLPERVVREAVANAVAHRTYEQRGTPVRVEMYKDRVEITSPGGLIAPVTVENMRDTYAARNNAVIRALRAFDLAEDSGAGVDLIQDMMRDELLAKPEFRATHSSVTVVLPVLSGTSPEERAWLREVVERGEIQDRDRVLLVHARRGELLTNQRARELLSTGRDGAMLALRRLVSAGLLEQTGRRGGTRYRLMEKVAPPAGLRMTRDELLDLIEAMADEGPVTNRVVRERTGLDRQGALSLLDELVKEDRLHRVGQKRGTRYLKPGAGESPSLFS